MDPGFCQNSTSTTVTMSPPNSNAVEPTCSPGRGQARGQRWGARPLRGGTHLDHSDTMSAAPTLETLCLPGPSPHSAVLPRDSTVHCTSKTSASCHTHHSPGCLDLRVATVTTKDGVGGELFKFRGVRRGRSGGSTNSQVLRKCFEKW
jgi:hypothetical protein